MNQPSYWVEPDLSASYDISSRYHSDRGAKTEGTEAEKSKGE